MSSDVLGISCCLLSATFFGSMFVPIKGRDIGNGIFVQWVMSIAILMFGFLIFALDGFGNFYPLAMLGGFFWAIGNSTAVPIINRIGMAHGILIWNTTNCLSGWAAGRFGFFGMKQHVPENIYMNYLGLCFVILGGAMFTFVKSTPHPITTNDGFEMANQNRRCDPVDTDKAEDSLLENSFERSITNGAQRIFAILLAACAGVFYGITFLPVNFMIERSDLYPLSPRKGVHYIFSHYSGIFMTSGFLMFVYSIVSKNKPFVSGSLVLPSTLTGIMWAIAQSSFFLANQTLSQTISFPIITMLPGLLGVHLELFQFQRDKRKKEHTSHAGGHPSNYDWCSISCFFEINTQSITQSIFLILVQAEPQPICFEIFGRSLSVHKTNFRSVKSTYRDDYRHRHQSRTFSQ